MNQKPKIVAITGPSASGKSSLAVEIAKKFDGEIISADSRYVYKEINIAAAKPSEAEKENIPHHLIDICSVEEDYSVGKFVKDADSLIKSISEKHKLPIIVGGTGLYFRSLRGTFDIPEVLPDYVFRKQAESIPNERLYKQLVEAAPFAAEKIHPNNKVKIVRALEIARANVKPRSKECPYEILWIFLNAKDRKNLYEKADLRVEKMFEQGLLHEAETLFKKYGQNSILMNTIGIKELYDVLYENADLDFAKSEIKKNTRRYIKRQISWFNGEQNLNTIYIDDGENVQDKAFALVEGFLK